VFAPLIDKKQHLLIVDSAHQTYEHSQYQNRSVQERHTQQMLLKHLFYGHLQDLHSLRSWVKQALDHNFALQEANLNRSIAEREVSKQRAGYSPKVDAVIEYQHSSEQDSVGFQTPKTTSTRYSLEFNYPLYQGGYVHTSSKQAYYRLLAAKDELNLTRRQVTQETRNLLRIVTTHVHKIHAQQQAIISTQAAFEASEKGLRVGTRNIVDTLQTQKNLYATERDYAHARYDYVIDWL